MRQRRSGDSPLHVSRPLASSVVVRRDRTLILLTVIETSHQTAKGDTLASVTLLSTRILTHWREFRPTLVRDLERSGELEEVVKNLEKTILEKRTGMIEEGMSLEQADEMLRPMWAISDGDI